MKVTCSAICGAASFNNVGPMPYVPVALHISIFERYFKTFSFSISEPQDKRRHETVLLSTNYRLNLMSKKIFTILRSKVVFIYCTEQNKNFTLI